MAKKKLPSRGGRGGRRLLLKRSAWGSLDATAGVLELPQHAGDRGFEPPARASKGAGRRAGALTLARRSRRRGVSFQRGIGRVGVARRGSVPASSGARSCGYAGGAAVRTGGGWSRGGRCGGGPGGG